MNFNFVNLVNKIFPRCTDECEAKTSVRGYFEQFDEEQKIEMAHNVCHQVGYYDLIVKILLAVFLFQTVYFSLMLR